MWRAQIACSFVLWMCSGAVFSADVAYSPVVYGFKDNVARRAVEQAARGALARLESQTCQTVIDDFFDDDGSSLSTMIASGKTPADMFRLLRFVDGQGTSQCRTRSVLAFTQAGSRVIRVCSSQFLAQFQHNRPNVEIILLHEFLHSLGLGEDPPTSQEITERVAAKCGDVTG